MKWKVVGGGGSLVGLLVHIWFDAYYYRILWYNTNILVKYLKITRNVISFKDKKIFFSYVFTAIFLFTRSK